MMTPASRLPATLGLMAMASLFTACQGIPAAHTAAYSQPRIEAIDSQQHTPQPFWHHSRPAWNLGWRNRDYQVKAFSACDGKMTGQNVTITLQSGDRIDGVCRLQFRPYPAATSR